MKHVIAAAAVATLAMSGMYAPPAHAYERWLRVHNASSVYICEVYISHVDRSSWGRDLLGPTTCIEPGYYVTVDPGYQQGYCMMDLMLVTEYQEEITDVINICELEDYWLYD